MRTLKVRRNLPKLTLYRHFTNTLIFAVIGKHLKLYLIIIISDILYKIFIFLASVGFMIWSLKRHRFVNCLKVFVLFILKK
jgi:hypothetical protein